ERPPFWLRDYRAAADAMIEEHASRPQQPPGILEIRRQRRRADVLDHADADGFVKTARVDQFAVVAILDAAAPFQPGVPDPLAGPFTLLAAQRDANRLDAVALGGELHEPAPTAADVQQALARSQPQLAADQVQFLLLRGVQVVVRRPEIGAGVDHPAV